MAELLPDGITDLRDLPHHLFNAIRVALLIASFDELAEDERPPKRIWNDGDKLKAFFEELKHRREEKYGDKGPGPIEDPVSNDAAGGLLVDG